MEITIDKAPHHLRRAATGNGEAKGTSSDVLNNNSDSVSLSDPEVLRKLYENMLGCRLLRERVRSLFREGGLHGDGWLSAGTEAVDVGATFELKNDDSLSVHERDMVTHTLKGLGWKALFAQLRNGRVQTSGCVVATQSLACNVLPLASNITAQLNLAAGVALAYRQQKHSNVVVALCGEAGAPFGSWYDAANLAGKLRLPIIFLVESGRRCKGPSQEWFPSAEPLSQRAHDYGFPGITVDGEDVAAVFRVTQESIHRARIGAGPTLIECAFSAASNRSNSARRSRDAAKDPLAHMEHYLKKRRAWKDDWKQQLVERMTDKIDRAITASRRDRASSPQK